LKTKSRSPGHQELKHRVAKRRGARVRNSFDEHLVELPLKHVFAEATMDERRLADAGPHLLEQLAKKCLADEIGKGLLQLRFVGCRRSGSRFQPAESSHRINCANFHSSSSTQ